MRAVVVDRTKQEAGFPCLKVLSDHDDEFVVLFTDESTGTVVAVTKGDYYPVGHFDDQWGDSRFTLFTGEVVLSN